MARFSPWLVVHAQTYIYVLGAVVRLMYQPEGRYQPAVPEGVAVMVDDAARASLVQAMAVRTQLVSA